MRNFGQELLLEVRTKAGDIVLSTTQLRIDFNIVDTSGFIRGSIDVYNLSSDMNASVALAGNIVNLTAYLHGKEIGKIVHDLSIMNTLTELKLPHAKTTLYGVSKVKKDHLEKQMDLVVEKPTLFNMVARIFEETGLVVPRTNFIGFPDELLHMDVPRNRTVLHGSQLQCLKQVGGEYNFDIFTYQDTVRLVFFPDSDNVGYTDLDSGNRKVALYTENMRSNPKIGIGQIDIDSNLDLNLAPSVTVDIRNLLTAGAGSDIPPEKLFYTDQYIANSVSGFSFYRITQVQHIGSNWTGGWNTKAVGSRPTQGKTMPTDPNRWFI